MLAAGLSAVPAAAERLPAGATLGTYLRARADDDAGRLEAAARGYAAVLAARPDDVDLATRTMRQAIEAGDRALAVRIARSIEARGRLPADGRLLLVAEAIASRDWAAARTQAGRLGGGPFDFLTPAINGWIAVGSRAPDPLAPLDAVKAGSLASAYAGEHRALILLATGRLDEGLAALRPLLAAGAGRAARLAIIAAAAADRGGRHDAALALLAGDDPVVRAARARVAANAPLAGSVASPSSGVAELLVRVAADMYRERVTAVALLPARIAGFLDPGNSEVWLVIANILGSGGQNDAALAALGRVALSDPFADVALNVRLRLLVDSGAEEQALAEARQATQGTKADAADWGRLGDLLADLNRQREAADAYGHAIEVARAAPSDPARDPWMLWMLRGGALERAGEWTVAEPALRHAVALAPEQPVVLNYLGYAQLERRQNIAEAQALVERASRLAPDDASIADSVGFAHYLRGDYSSAISIFEQAVVKEPGEPTINEHLGDAYWAVGRRLEARYAWNAALVQAEHGDVVRLRAKIVGGADVTARP